MPLSSLFLGLCQDVGVLIGIATFLAYRSTKPNSFRSIAPDFHQFCSWPVSRCSCFPVSLFSIFFSSSDQFGFLLGREGLPALDHRELAVSLLHGRPHF